MTGAIMLVGCGAAKVSHPVCHARDLYTGSLFLGARRVAEARGARWAIVSGLHGLVMPHWPLAPYEARRPSGAADAARWAEELVAARMDALGHRAPVELFMGEAYARPLRPALEALGLTVTEPLAGLPMGLRLRRLSELRKVG